MSEADRDQAIQLLNDAKMASDANQKASLLLSFSMSQNSCHNQSYSAENIVVTFHRRWQDICCWRSAKRFLDPLYVFHYCAVHFPGGPPEGPHRAYCPQAASTAIGAPHQDS